MAPLGDFPALAQAFRGLLGLGQRFGAQAAVVKAGQRTPRVSAQVEGRAGLCIVLWLDWRQGGRQNICFEVRGWGRHAGARLRLWSPVTLDGAGALPGPGASRRGAGSLWRKC